MTRAGLTINLHNFSSRDSKHLTTSLKQNSIGESHEGVQPNYFLLKSEPSEFSILDLEKKVTEEWDGVRNFEARNIMRTMKIGDRCLFYHSNCKKPLGPGIVGTAKILREAIPDKTAIDPTHKNHDPKSTSIDNCRWDSVLVEFESKFPFVILLKDLKAEAKQYPHGVIASMDLLHRNRLSISRVSPEQWDSILSRIDL